MKFIGKTTIVLIAVLLCTKMLFSQRYDLKAGEVIFKVVAPASALTANNDSVTGVIDLNKGSIDFRVTVSGFQFTTPSMPDLMRKGASLRFHKYYFNSEEYPIATFKGNIAKGKSINFSVNDSFPIQSKGILSMHGVSKEIEVKGMITIEGGKASVKSSFLIDPRDFKVRIPEEIEQFYFKEVEIQVAGQLSGTKKKVLTKRR